MKKIFAILLLFFSSDIFSQNVDDARKTIDTLTSKYYWGRGYTNNGMNKAATYLSNQLAALRLQPFNGKSYQQYFEYAVNTFPGKMEVTLDGRKLQAGQDFIVSADSKGVKAKGKLVLQDSSHFVDHDNRIIFSLESKLTWSVAPQRADFTTILLNKDSVTGIPQRHQVNIENKFVKNFKAANVGGIVKGTLKPDSFIVFTAHYDHLGGMGSSTYFPGANDNASGISLLLGLAKYYAANPPPYSVAFICFAGEEAGLIGSKHFAENALIPLASIRFLTNVDLVGTGEEGITIVNATEFKKEFELINKLNDENSLITKINARGKAANSDHYWFTEKGVPAFFIYTLGGVKAYHDVFDISATLPLTEYEDLFKLIVAFNKGLMQ